jgi:hypothetical protein
MIGASLSFSVAQACLSGLLSSRASSSFSLLTKRIPYARPVRMLLLARWIPSSSEGNEFGISNLLDLISSLRRGTIVAV